MEWTTIDWIDIMRVKALVVEAKSILEEEPNNIVSVTKSLNEAAIVLHDLETQYIDGRNIGERRAG